jgi:tetratricopeptide (TPR) repeat protein
MMKVIYPRLCIGVSLCALAMAWMPGVVLAQPLPSASELRALSLRGEYDAVIQQARIAISRAPENAPLWTILGQALFAVGDLTGAEEAFARAADLPGEDQLEALLNVALTLQYRGQREKAVQAFRKVYGHYAAHSDQSAAELTAVARAAQELGAGEASLYHEAVRLYGQALAADVGNIDARIALGELLLSKYNNTEAVQVFREAMAQNPDHPGVQLSLARSQHFDHNPEALDTVWTSLERNPRYVPAYAFLARLLIESEEYEAAEQQALRALEVNPNSLQTLAVLAAVYYLTGREQEFKATVARCLHINARYADLYNTLAELSVQNRLYHDAVTFAQQAVALDPGSWRGYGLLGLNQLRLGEMQVGRMNLERAFAGDPFNVWTKNTLDLLDTLGDYEIIRQPPFLLVLHRDEASVLAPYLGALAQQAYDHYVKQYAYEPQAPIRIELYPSHADFSVRSVGLAGIGILGVSFGSVVALDSPSVRVAEQSNWGSTVWHELAHTFHLGMTRHRVPRWFSEGLAVYEEQRAREGWGGDATPAFLKAYRDGKLYPVSQLSNGFVRPRYPQHVIHSYYQASLVFAFIEERWGFPAIRQMLNGYRDGGSTAEVFQAALNTTLARLDREFDAYLRRSFARALAALPAEPGGVAPEGDFELQMRAGVQALANADGAQAETHLLRAQALFPEYAGADSAYWHLAELYTQRHQHAQAAAQLQRMVSINADHYDAHIKLAALHETLGDVAAAADTLARAIYIDPFEPSLHTRLASLYERLQKWPQAARERAALVALKPVDMAQARYDLAYAYARAGKSTPARREVLRALELVPNFPEALELLLELEGYDVNSDASASLTPATTQMKPDSATHATPPK